MRNTLLYVIIKRRIYVCILECAFYRIIYIKGRTSQKQRNTRIKELFRPLWSQKLKITFHQFLLIDLLEE